jgi:hypothetical protein
MKELSAALEEKERHLKAMRNEAKLQENTWRSVAEDK